MHRLLSFFIATLLSLVGCASTPTVEDKGLEALPVVRIDQSIPRGKGYVLHFPAGHEVNTRVTLQGDLIAEKAEVVLDTMLDRDIYVYKDRVSFDRKTWSRARNVFGFTVTPQLPDYEDPISSQIDMRLDVLQ